MLYVILIHIFEWATNEDVHTVHVCMYIHCTVYMFIQANIHTVCIHAGLLVLTWNVISAHDCT